MTGPHNTEFCAEKQPPSVIMGSVGRPRVWEPIPDTNGYTRHPDGRVRDRHRHPVKDLAIVAALTAEREYAAKFVLACCGKQVRVDCPKLAVAHWSDCLSDMQSTGSPRNAPTGRLDPDRYYSRELATRRAPRRAVLDKPMVLAHNGRSDAGRRIRIMPWVTAARIMLQQKEFGDDLPETRRRAS